MNVINYATLHVPNEALKSINSKKGSYRFIEGDILDANLLESVVKQYDIQTIIRYCDNTGYYTRTKI